LLKKPEFSERQSADGSKALNLILHSKVENLQSCLLLKEAEKSSTEEE
jgi:hypothetical protein